MGLGIILLEKHLDLDLITLFWQEILSKAMGSAGKLRQKLERDRQDSPVQPHSPIYLGSDLRSLPQDDSGTCRQDVLGPGIHSSSSF